MVAVQDRRWRRQSLRASAPIIVGVLVLGACGGTGRQASSSATTHVDACAQAATDARRSIRTLLDRIDAEPAAVANHDEMSAVARIMGDDGAHVGAACQSWGAGGSEALSGLLEYLASEGAKRPVVTAAMVNGIISGICRSVPAEANLTDQARMACAVG